MTDSASTPVGSGPGHATSALQARPRLAGVFAEAVAAGIVAFVAAIGLESLAFRVAAGRLDAFEWISDALLAIALVGVCFLWLRLRASWDAFSRLERAKVALDTQLELAAGIQSRAADGRELSAVNAGHPAGVVLGAAGMRLLDVGGPPAGLFPGTRYECQRLELSAGDVGLLVTDGISEPAESVGGLEALLRRTAGAAGTAPDPARIAEVLLRAALPTDGSEPPDDRTLVVFVAGP